jgi:hypothetical protein
MSTTIHVVATNYRDQHGTTKWFWDREEATRLFNATVEELGDTHEVMQYRVDVQEAIDQFIADSIEDATAEKVNESYPAKQAEEDEARATLEGMLASARITLKLDRERLESYRTAPDSAEPDTKALIERTQKKIIAGSERIKGLEYALTKF